MLLQDETIVIVVLLCIFSGFIMMALLYVFEHTDKVNENRQCRPKHRKRFYLYFDPLLTNTRRILAPNFYCPSNTDRISPCPEQSFRDNPHPRFCVQFRRNVPMIS